MYVLFSFLCFFLHRQLKEENNNGKEKLRIDQSEESLTIAAIGLQFISQIITLESGNCSLVHGLQKGCCVKQA